METNEIHCPKCGSTQITANKKGFSGGKAVVGAALTGGIGLLAGTIGSSKVMITCLNCGKEFKPGEGKNSTGDTFQQQKKHESLQRFKQKKELKEIKLATDPEAFKRAKTNLLTFSIIFFVASIFCLVGTYFLLGYFLLFIAILIFFKFVGFKKNIPTQQEIQPQIMDNNPTE